MDMINICAGKTNRKINVKSLKRLMRIQVKSELRNLIETTGDNFNFSFEGALYWLGNHYHSGQKSLGYAVLSVSEYSPGKMIGNIEDEKDGDMCIIYGFLSSKYKKIF